MVGKAVLVTAVSSVAMATETRDGDDRFEALATRQAFKRGARGARLGFRHRPTIHHRRIVGARPHGLRDGRNSAAAHSREKAALIYPSHPGNSGAGSGPILHDTERRFTGVAPAR